MQIDIIAHAHARRETLTGVKAICDASTPKQSLDCLKKMPSFLKDFIKSRTLSTSGISTKPWREREKERECERDPNRINAKSFGCQSSAHHFSLRNNVDVFLRVLEAEWDEKISQFILSVVDITVSWQFSNEQHFIAPVQKLKTKRG